MSPVNLVQQQLDTYNAQDLDGFLACYTDDVVVADLNGAVSSSGIAALRRRYAEMFAAYPNNHARLVNRIAVGNIVVDHEDVRRSPDAPLFQAIAIYTIKDAKIARVDFVKASP
jgi:hypothetical protein